MGRVLYAVSNAVETMRVRRDLQRLTGGMMPVLDEFVCYLFS